MGSLLQHNVPSCHTRPEVLILNMQWFHAKNKSPVSAGGPGPRCARQRGLMISCVGVLIDLPAYVCSPQSPAGRQQFPLSILFNHAGQGLGGRRQTDCIGLGPLYLSKQAAPGCQPYWTRTLFVFCTVKNF